jgi:hypothetical protein
MNTPRPNPRLGGSPRRILLAAALLAMVTAATRAADNPSHAVSLQFLHPIATSPDPETDSAVRLSLLYGRSAQVRLLDLNLVAGVTSGDVGGLQFSGLYSGVGGGLSGFSLTGGVSLVQEGVRGVQWSGLVSWSQGVVTGMQVGGFLNVADRGLRGAQISGMLNQNSGAGGYLQFATVANVNGGDFRGAQLAGLFNFAGEELSGLQAGVLNFADAASGVQVGAINLVREMKGLQFGVVNASRELSGVPVGVVNLSDDDHDTWMFYTTNLSMANAGFRTDVNGWVSSLSLGFGDAQGSTSTTLNVAWNYGRRILGSPGKSLGVDVGWVHIIPEATDDPTKNDRLHGAFQGRVTGDIGLNEGLGLWAAAGFSTIFAEYDRDAPSETELLLAGGVVLR